MEIRVNRKDLIKLRKQKTLVTGMVFTLDESVDIPVFMMHINGEFSEYMRGMKNIQNFLKYGYNRIIRNCPHRVGKCIGEKCSFYHVWNNTGDCAEIWQVELLWKIAVGEKHVVQSNS